MRVTAAAGGSARPGAARSARSSSSSARPGPAAAPSMREGSALPGGPGAAAVPGFLAKLWALVEDPQSDDVICWSRVSTGGGREGPQGLPGPGRASGARRPGGRSPLCAEERSGARGRPFPSRRTGLAGRLPRGRSVPLPGLRPVLAAVPGPCCSAAPLCLVPGIREQRRHRPGPGALGAGSAAGLGPGRSLPAGPGRARSGSAALPGYF